MGEHFKDGPSGHEALIPRILEALAENPPPFIDHLATVELEWLDADDDRLGNTRFEASRTELEVRRKHRMPPGPITIGLHPILLEDAALYTHTLAHELLHAAGLLEHDTRHAALVEAIAPAPSLAGSEVLQRLQKAALERQAVRSWTCGHCGHGWQRTTVRTPTRCIKCARPL